jgi:hypothetical protein
MPKKLTEEQKQAAFETWTNSEEYTRIQALSLSRGTFGTVEMATKDITDNWDTFLRELYDVGTALKVPGRKAKRKEWTV